MATFTGWPRPSPRGPGGSSTIAGPDGSRQPIDDELAIARFQGQHVAEIAGKLAAR